MNAPAQNPEAWSRGRWWFAVVVVFVLQLGLIFALGERHAPAPRAVADIPHLDVTANGGELLELHDPTLFALPHARGFSAANWLRESPYSFPSFHWTEPPRNLEISVAQLGEPFLQFMETNRFASPTLEAKPAPEIHATLGDIAEAIPPATTLELAGDLASRRLLKTPELDAWSNGEVLTNTVVQTLVDASGAVLSAVAIPPGCGSADADSHALDIALGLRFAPLSTEGWRGNPARELTRGLIIFHWRTEPPISVALPAPKP